MPAAPLTAVDAQFLWASAKIPSDEFLLYAFAGEPADLPGALRGVHERARRCPALSVRVDDDSALRYPRWVAAEPAEPVVHVLADDTWAGCLTTVARLGERQLDSHVIPWRLHVFPAVRELPGAPHGTVAVLQIAHALADGGRAATLAGWLFGRPGPPAPIPAGSRGRFLRRALQAAWAQRQLDREIATGVIAPSAGTRKPLRTNTNPTGDRTVRTLVRRRDQLTGPSVTVAVLTAVAEALANHLDEPADTLAAEVPMAKPGAPQANNHFQNVTVGLYPHLDRPQRAARIAADLAESRRRVTHPATRAADRAFAAVPAPLLRWGMSRLDPAVRPAQVSGNTVVSSVNRGAADLRLGSAPVLLTAGYPALSPVMGLTHGVHGIGETVAVSVHAAASAIGDADVYLRHLDAAL